MPYDLMHQYDANAKALPISEVIENCPAVMTDIRSPDTSKRYGLVNTMEAMNVLSDYGYRPTRAIQQPNRIEGREKFNKHLIAFSHKNDLDKTDLESRTEVLLYNSHDGKSSLKLFSGIFRFVCDNGIVAGEGFKNTLRHSHTTANNFEKLLTNTLDGLPQVKEQVERLSKTDLTVKQILDLAKEAANLRWKELPESEFSFDMKDPETGLYYTEDTIREISLPTRYEDNGANAWKVFNRVQESILKGGVHIRSITDRHIGQNKIYGIRRKARAITALPENIRLNQSLWNMTHEMVA
tara:strand:- start:549 stop:1436 length:888 start_codon:yes stop_codon:yes gene_type:complete